MANLKQKPLRYGLYGENDLLSSDFMHCEIMAHQNKRHNSIIKEHLHNSLFQIFIVEAGTLNFVIENIERLVEGPAIITMPENILHGLTVGKGIKGKVLTLSTSFLEKFFNHSSHILTELGSPKIITEFGELNSFDKTVFFADNLSQEMNEDLPEKKLVLECYFNLLLSLTYRLIKRNSEKLFVPNNKNTRYISNFQKSVKKSYTPMKSIKEYASELNITSVHLNRICQARIGKPALQIVHDFLIKEAERFLRHTDLQVSEIAYQLNFEDPAYFSRFFKKYTGASPKEFREKV